jgi:hypothetical protein
LILSFGGEYYMQDELPDDEKEHAKVMKTVTHFCLDRPLPAGQTKEKGVEYVQPQYIIDSINNLFLLPTKVYLPGIPAPAHLSPFVDNVAEGYIPDRQREINAMAGIDEEVMTGGRILRQSGALVDDSQSDDEDGKDGEGKDSDDDEEMSDDGGRGKDK